MLTREIKHVSFVVALLLSLMLPLFPQELSTAEILENAKQNIEQYRKGPVLIQVVNSQGKPIKKLSVTVNQESHDFMFGALLFDLVNRDMSEGERDKFKEQFTNLFNYGIFPYYWGPYEPVAGHPRWEQMDETLEWASNEGITCKGHPLAWTHRIGLPDYILDMELQEAWMMQHARIIENIVGFDKISIWDVVNEPVNTVTWSMAHADKEKENRYRNDIPLEQIAQWVEQAYKTAGAANPDKIYILNEFKQIADIETRERFYQLVEILLERDTPINGIGIQAHEPREEWYAPKEVWATLEQYSSFGLPLHITEFSPQSEGAEITGGYRTGIWNDKSQAQYAELMYTMFFGHPSVESINWWGFSDVNAWLPGCGITDEELNPKEVYHLLDRLINTEWSTRNLELETDRKGAASFRGFYGKYSIEITTPEGASKKVELHVEKGKDNEFVIQI